MSASEGTQAPVSKKKQQKTQVLHLDEFKTLLQESPASRSWGDEEPEEDRNYSSSNTRYDSRDRYNGDSGGRSFNRDSSKGYREREYRREDGGPSSEDSKWERTASEVRPDNDNDRERGDRYRSNDYGRGGDRSDYSGRGGGDRNSFRERSEYGGRGERSDFGRGERSEYGSRGDRSDFGRGERSDFGRADRNRVYDNKPKELPTQPPWDAYVGNLAYELEERAIEDFFSKDCKVKRVRLQRNRETGQPLGYAYVEFEDLESLKTALNLNGENFQTRNIRVDVATRSDKSRSDTDNKWTRRTDVAESRPSERNERGGGGYNRGFRDYDRNRESGRDNDRYRDNDRNRDNDRDQEKEERQRPKLNLLPRSVDNPVGTVATKVTPKSDPFGGARPRDESAFLKKKQEASKETPKETPAEPSKEIKETQKEAKYTPPHSSARTSKADRQDWRNDNKDQKDSRGAGKAWGKGREEPEHEHSEDSRPTSKGREKTEEAPKKAIKREEKPKTNKNTNHNVFSALSADN